MLTFSINETRCTRCGQCAQECPPHIIEQSGNNLPSIKPENEVKCMQCQHCLALCPTAALSILGRNPDDSQTIHPKDLPTLDSMITLVRGRRSIRHYRNENVDRALLKRLLDALANAPTGVNKRMLNFHVLDDKDVMELFRKQSMQAAAAAAAANAIPERYAYLARIAELYRDKGKDVIFRGAPHLLVISEAPDAPCPPQDVALALAYFELLAQSAEIGTVWCGLLKLLLEALPETKRALGIPADHEYYAMLFGYPSIQFARTVQRDDGAKIRRISI
jgi:nitroreductase/NAD-dependent dihydropyrimidine dehydrogenase PreA subunit